MSTAASLNTSEFSVSVENAQGVTLVDFWADWCGPCKMLAPVIDEIAKDYDGKAAVYKVNVDEESELAVRFGIMSIPTLIIFKNGEIFEKLIGVVPKESIAQALNRALA